MALKPVLGPVQLIFYSVGVIVGAGVYSVIGSAAGLAQQSLWVSFVFNQVFPEPTLPDAPFPAPPAHRGKPFRPRKGFRKTGFDQA